MTKINDRSRKQGHSGLDQLAQPETRVPRAQTELIVHQELGRRGILPKKTKVSGTELPPESETEGGITTTSQPPQTSPFTAEQRQILGQVYRLILSWRKEKRAVKFTSVEIDDNHVEENNQSNSSESGGSED
jgi:hypothetical protein